jgi:tellurite resistance protein TehA-like permease
MVMATGIVATGLRHEGWQGASDALVAIAAAVWLAAVTATLARLALAPAGLRADGRAPGPAFGWYAVVAACVVLGSCLASLGGDWVPAASALAAVAVVAWLTVTSLVPARFGHRSARPDLRGITGSWYLWPVGTQSLAIAAAVLTANGVLPVGPGVITAIVAWSAGVALYLATSILVATRLVRAGLGPAGTRAAYWVAMGAAAISVLAVALILRIPRAPAVAAADPALKAVGLVLWSAGTALYPVLTVLTALWWTRTRRRPGYHPSSWVIVFPLGMYAAASWQLGSATGLAVVREIGEVAVWPAAAAWTVTAAGLTVALASRARHVFSRRTPNPRPLPHRLRADHSAAPRHYTFEALVTIPSPDKAAVGVLPGPDWHGVIRATAAGPAGSPSLFSALVDNWDLHASGRPGDAEALARIVAFGPQPADCLPVGATFALWRGRDVARGVVTRRIFV